jgi:hypothetical protein
MSNSFTITIDRTLEELKYAYIKHFKLPSETKVIKRDIFKLISELSEKGIDILNEDREDNGSLDIDND